MATGTRRGIPMACSWARSAGVIGVIGVILVMEIVGDIEAVPSTAGRAERA